MTRLTSCPEEFHAGALPEPCMAHSSSPPLQTHFKCESLTIAKFEKPSQFVAKQYNKPAPPTRCRFTGAQPGVLCE